MSLSEMSIFDTVVEFALLHLQNRAKEPRQACHVTMAVIQSASDFLPSVTLPKDSAQCWMRIGRELPLFPYRYKRHRLSWPAGYQSLHASTQNLFPISSDKYLSQAVTQVALIFLSPFLWGFLSLRLSATQQALISFCMLLSVSKSQDINHNAV